MSTVTIQRTFKVDGVLTDVTSCKLSDPTATFGVKRNDTDEVVVADDTAMTKVSTGVYRHTFTEPAAGLTYTYWVEWVYSGETYHEEHTVSGVSADARICTLSDVKDRLGEESSDYDDMLTRMILGLEGIFNGHVARELIAPAADVTEYYTGLAEFLQLRRYPVIAITSIKEAADYDFDSADALTVDEEYRLMREGVNGIALRIYARWLTVPDSIQVVYRGGYCAAGQSPGEGETALPNDIREAAIEQATFLYKRKDDLGLSSVGFQGGSISKFSAIELLPQVKKVLDKYRIATL